MKKIIINENQRGILFKSGRFDRVLNPGMYLEWFNDEIEVMSIKSVVYSQKASVDVLMKNNNFKSQTVCVEVSDCHLALHFVNGKFDGILSSGKYAYWTAVDRHEFKMIDISSPIVSEDVPKYIFEQISPCDYIKIEVAEYQKCRLYFNRRLEKILDAGTYYFWKNEVKIDADYIDTRLTRLDIVGQEILTHDKVSVRVNFVCNYKITDYVKIFTEIDDYVEQIHVAAQLALRYYIGKYSIDEILANKEEMSEFVFNRLKEREADFYVKFADAGVKDIILPGEIRDIMNTVLIAEKQAQANVITRREEVASTRSLFNTAKLMDENKTLYKLKELEYVQRICENVGNINVGGSGDLLTQLTAILQKNPI